MRRRVVIAVSVLAFAALSVLVGRWLHVENVERDEVTGLLRDQARGDLGAMLRRVECEDARCRAQLRENARRLKAPGEVEIARYDSGTSHSLGSATEPTRVVWITPGRLTTVQCILVHRDGNAVSGASVSLLRMSGPIDRESSCP